MIFFKEKSMRTQFVVICACLVAFAVCTFDVRVAYSQNSVAINQLVNGDVVGPLAGPSGTGGAPFVSIFSGSSALGGGIPLTGLLGGGAGASGVFSTVSSIVGLFSSGLQNAFMAKFSNLMLNNASVAQIAQLAAQFQVLDTVFNNIKNIKCGGGAGLHAGTAFQVYAQNNLLQQVSQMNPQNLLSGGALSAGNTLANLATSVCGAGAGSIQALVPGLAPGAVAAPTTMTTNGQWTQKTSDHILGRTWSPNSASGTTTCAKGVRLLLGDHPNGLGMPIDTTCHGGSRNGHDYKQILTTCNPQWTLQPSVSRPEDAPPGCINTYDSNCRMGKTPCSRPPATGGQAYGHVEVVATQQDGTKKYVSFKTLGPGGTVKQNYSGTFCCTGGGCTPSVR